MDFNQQQYFSEAKKKQVIFISMSVRVRFAVFLIMLMAFPGILSAQQKFFIHQSKIQFLSEAQLETISATSTELKGVVDPANKTFAFSVSSKSFVGFNSPLQQEHYNDNYLESDKYPVITFTGKIIDEVDFDKPGVYMVRAKGMLTIKGISREQIIRAKVDVKQGQFTITTNFDVLLDDYNIRIPRVVSQKISPVIKISMESLLKPQKK